MVDSICCRDAKLGKQVALGRFFLQKNIFCSRFAQNILTLHLIVNHHSKTISLHYEKSKKSFVWYSTFSALGCFVISLLC